MAIAAMLHKTPSEVMEMSEHEFALCYAWIKRSRKQ